jgi:hypothetical protein
MRRKSPIFNGGYAPGPSLQIQIMPLSTERPPVRLSVGLRSRRRHDGADKGTCTATKGCPPLLRHGLVVHLAGNGTGKEMI